MGHASLLGSNQKDISEVLTSTGYAVEVGHSEALTSRGYAGEVGHSEVLTLKGMQWR